VIRNHENAKNKPTMKKLKQKQENKRIKHMKNKATSNGGLS
jgi:hypothetical protein